MSKNVLVVEDDEVIRENLKEILEMEGYDVSLARNGQVALDFLRSLSSSPDSLPFLILLDLNMPVMSGPEFLKVIKMDTSPLANIPVIVMTAVPNPEVLGAAQVLKKPLDLDELLSKIQNLAPAAA